MSYYVADVGVVKVKPELVEQFGYFYNGEFEKITDEYMNDFIRVHEDEVDLTDYCWNIRAWSHDNEKPEWIGKYQTSFENGIFTYGISYNAHGRLRGIMLDIFDDLLPYITESVIVKDGWAEAI